MQTQSQTNVAHYQFSHRETMGKMSSEPTNYTEIDHKRLSQIWTNTAELCKEGKT